jgi:hypothetical protein
MTAITQAGTLPATADDQSFLLKRVQPALSGLMDGSLSTLAPIFAVVLATHHPLTAFYTGGATALGAGVSMAFSEGLSDTGDLTGRGRPVLRGAITGGGTFAGGIFHTLPFLIPWLRRGDHRRDRRGGYRTAHPGLAAAQVFPDQLRPVVPRGHRRRNDHRLAKRCPGHPRGGLKPTTSDRRLGDRRGRLGLRLGRPGRRRIDRGHPARGGVRHQLSCRARLFGHSLLAGRPPPRGCALVLGRAAPDAMKLPGSQRECQAFAPDPADRADRLGFRRLLAGRAGSRDREEQLGIGRPAGSS